MLAVARSAAVDEADGVRDALRLSGLDPAGMFVGKALAVAAELAVLEVLLGAGWCSTAPTRGRGTVGRHLPGGDGGRGLDRYAVRRPGQRPASARDTAPPAAPARAGAGADRRHRAFEAALDGSPADGWPWCGLLAAFAVLYSAAGALAYGTLLEGS